MNAYQLYQASLERSPSLGGSSSSSRASSPAFPQTPQLEPYQNNASSYSSYPKSDTNGRGASHVLARQQAMLERSTSSASLGQSNTGLTRQGSIQSIKRLAATSDAYNDLPTPRASRSHTAHNSISSMEGLARTRSSEGSSYLSKYSFEDSTKDKYGLPYSPPAADRYPLSSRSSTLPTSTESAPATPSYRDSRFQPKRVAPLPTAYLSSVDSAPSLSSFRQSTTDQAEEHYQMYRPDSMSRSVTAANLDSTSSVYERTISPITATGDFSSIISASRSHQRTKSVPTLPNLGSYSTLPSQNRTPLPTERLGHGSRHGLDRLSEHWEQEQANAEAKARSPSPKATPFPSSRPFSPPTYLTSPELDRQREMHVPGAISGQVETHRGKGASGRIVLARKPTISTSGLVLASNSARAMDIGRKHVAAYEYLTHVAEAQGWLDRELRRDHDYDMYAPEANLTSHGVVAFEQSLRNGVALAKLARVFEGESVVPRHRIREAGNALVYRHTDNINHFFNFIKRRSLPTVYHFETTDLYNARNIPKVIYCIHALNLFLVSQGQTERMRRIRDLEFSESQLDATNKEIQHLAMPNFKGLSKDIPVDEPEPELELEPEPEPEPEPETEEQRLDRLIYESNYELSHFVCQARSRLAQRRLAELKWQRRTVPKLQAVMRGRLARQSLAALRQRKDRSTETFIKIQAQCRGYLVRQRFWQTIEQLEYRQTAITGAQARIRGLLARRSHQKTIQAMSRSSHFVTGCQTAIRRLLAQQRLLHSVQQLRKSSSSITAFQARARSLLAQRRYWDILGGLEHPYVVHSIVEVQSAARGYLTRRNQHMQTSLLHTAHFDIVELQAYVRGENARLDFQAWLFHLRSNQWAAVLVQALARGHLARMRFWQMQQHYYDHMEKVVKVQAVFRRKQKQQQYNELTRGRNVPIGTVKNFLHLLQDSDLDYAEEIDVERLRKDVIQAIRDNQVMESDVQDLDTKIALMVKNKMSIDELLRGRRPPNNGMTSRRSQDSVLAANGDPFATGALDRQSQAKLELYQELFFLLQTKPEYLARLFQQMTLQGSSERDRKDVERIVLSLFGYAQNTREEYLLLRLFQRSLHQEIVAVDSLDDFIRTDYIFIKLIVQYGRGAKERKYFQDTLTPLVNSVVDNNIVDLETDPCVVYRNLIAAEEQQTGVISQRERNLSARQVLSTEPTFSIFSRNLSTLKHISEQFLVGIISSAMPFGMRWIAREMDRALRLKFPKENPEAIFKVVCHFVYYRYINPAIVAPETFGVQNSAISPDQRRTLAEVSKILNQVSAGRKFNLEDGNECLTPLNTFIIAASARFSGWLQNMINVVDAEEYFHADAFIDHVTSSQQSIYISPNEVYLIQRLLVDNVSSIVRNHDDAMHALLRQLGSAPQFTTEELSRARATEVALKLTSRNVDPSSPREQESARLNTLFTSTKRMILSILKIQPGENLRDALEMPVTHEQEMLWDQERSSPAQQRRRMPQTFSSPDLNNLNDLHHLNFAQLKSLAHAQLLELQHFGKLPTSDESFQEMLNALAKDIKQKNRKRIQRGNEKETMKNTLSVLHLKRGFLDDQLRSYDEYVKQTQATMHKRGKKRITMPFSPQYFHERNLAKDGKKPQFGSFIYKADKLHADGILISIDQVSTSRFDQVKLAISCDEVGIFDIAASMAGVTVASARILYSDLLDAQYNNKQVLQIADMAVVHVNMLLYLIHKKFYA